MNQINFTLVYRKTTCLLLLMLIYDKLVNLILNKLDHITYSFYIPAVTFRAKFDTVYRFTPYTHT